MIKELTDKEKLEELSYTNIIDGKIKVNYLAYDMDNKFCRFFTADESLLISELDRDFVIKTYNNDYDIEEVAAFLQMSGVSGVFCDTEFLHRLEPLITADIRYNNLMLYDGETDVESVCNTPRLDDVYKVVSSGFAVDYGQWLTDLSHKVRHGISTVYLYKDISTATALYDRENTVYITQVATLPEQRKKGHASAMLKGICGKYKADGKKVYLICRDALVPFYEHCGFKVDGKIGRAYFKYYCP